LNNFQTGMKLKQLAARPSSLHYKKPTNSRLCLKVFQSRILLPGSEHHASGKRMVDFWGNLPDWFAARPSSPSLNRIQE